MIPHEYKPETDEERAERKAKEEESLVFKNVSFNEATARIAEVLFKTTYLRKIPIDETQPKTLGNVAFWIDFANENGPMLRYSKPPKKWDRDAVIFELEKEEHDLIFLNR